MDDELLRLVRELDRAGRPQLVESSRKYHGSPLPTLAVPVPEVHRIAREFGRRNGGWPSRRLVPLLRGLWSGRTYDERLLAIELLGRAPETHDAATWRLAAAWVDTATGWALSDSLASGPIARRVASDPRRFSVLMRWTRSPNPWRRRAATYALHDLVLAGDLSRPLSLLARLRSDPEFWVQRAVGTWLRECWKKDPQRTERFLRRHAGALAPVTVTVATERAPVALREELRRRHPHYSGVSRRGHAHIHRAS